MVYEDYDVYGPYTRSDGRKHVCMRFKTNKTIRKTVSYPKYLMEIFLDRYLQKYETVDHIDRDFTNDCISNLQVLDRTAHSKLDAKYNLPVEFECELCGTDFVLSGKRLHDAYNARLKGHRGPFCGRSCAGRASHMIESFEIKEVTKTSSKLDKARVAQ